MLLQMLATGAALSCASTLGADRLWTEPRTVFVGELHGTEEAPRAFGDLVCAAFARSERVFVALELGADLQPALDAFLMSDGGAAARDRFLQQQFWASPFKDGRASEAYFRLIERLRRLRRTSPDLRVIDFVSPPKGVAGVVARPAGENGNDITNNVMAQALNAERVAFPDRIILVLTGSVHAARVRVTAFGAPFLPAAARTDTGSTLSLLVQQEEGSAWNCSPDCGVHPTAAASPRAPVGVTFRPVEREALGVGKAYDGLLVVGPRFTASPPMAPASRID